VASYAQAGADVVVTSSPYLAKPKDVQVDVAAVGENAHCLVA
jgi:molybdenum transport protein